MDLTVLVGAQTEERGRCWRALGGHALRESTVQAGLAVGEETRVSGGRPHSPHVSTVSFTCLYRVAPHVRWVRRGWPAAPAHALLGTGCRGSTVASRSRFSAFHPDTRKPMHRECGFIRLQPDTNKVAFVSAQNTGIVEVEEGEVNGQELCIASHSIARISFAKEPHVEQITRKFRLNSEGKLEQTVSMATTTQPLTQHLHVTYKKWNLPHTHWPSPHAHQHGPHARGACALSHLVAEASHGEFHTVLFETLQPVCKSEKSLSLLLHGSASAAPSSFLFRPLGGGGGTAGFTRSVSRHGARAAMPRAGVRAAATRLSHTQGHRRRGRWSCQCLVCEELKAAGVPPGPGLSPGPHSGPAPRLGQSSSPSLRGVLSSPSPHLGSPWWGSAKVVNLRLQEAPSFRVQGR
uniref:THAP4-like heme-binding domain-containing protein n=1 Tax=Capra hircus TaxID=9925 RepID=A0A8C2NDD1_CAPHI